MFSSTVPPCRRFVPCAARSHPHPAQRRGGSGVGRGRLVEVGKISGRQSARAVGRCLAHERHVIHAPQDAAVGGLRKADAGRVHVAERFAGNCSRRSSRPIKPVTRRPGSRRPAARTSASKTLNSVTAWVTSRHLRPLSHSRFAYQSSPSGGQSASCAAWSRPGASSCTARSPADSMAVPLATGLTAERARRSRDQAVEADLVDLARWRNGPACS